MFKYFKISFLFFLVLLNNNVFSKTNVDKQARTTAWDGAKKLIVQVGTDPTAFASVISTIATGNSVEDWQAVNSDTTDAGRKNHLVTRGAENGIASIVLVAGLVQNIDKITENLSNKLESIKKAFASISELVENIVKNRSLIRGNIIDLAETKRLAIEYAQHIGIKDADFEDWFKNTFKTYESGAPNFEAHHVIPVEVLQSNPDLQKLLFDLQKANPNFKFDFNGLDNGMMLQKKSLNLDISGHANHPKYNEAISKKITEILNTPSNLNKPEKAFVEIQDLIKNTKQRLETDVLLGNNDVNSIVNF
jgi:hypothetical protein